MSALRYVFLFKSLCCLQKRAATLTVCTAALKAWFRVTPRELPVSEGFVSREKTNASFADRKWTPLGPQRVDKKEERKETAIVQGREETKKKGWGRGGQAELK